MKAFLRPLLILYSLLFTSAIDPQRQLTNQKFTVVLLPDTQHYTMPEYFELDKTYDKQANWIARNRKSFNIKFVIHLGDITHNDDNDEWDVARHAHDILDVNKIPYSVVPGNHDNPLSGKIRSTKNFNDYFGPQWFENEESSSWYGGHLGGTNDNNYCFFESGKLKFMVVSLEFAPRKEALCWADNIISKHKDRRVIIVTHCYQTHNGGYRSDCASGYGLIGSDGKVIWNELVNRHNNIFMVLSGHVSDAEHNVVTNFDDRKVIQMLTDYQSEEWPGTGKNHGNGWMRTLTFDPVANKIQVETFTVVDGITELGLLDSDHDGAYNSNPQHAHHKFTLDYDMASPMPAYQRSADPNLFLFNDMTVNTESNRNQLAPDITVGADGDFIVVWEDDSRGAANVYEIYARGLSRGGCETIPTMTVNVDRRGQQRHPRVARAKDNSFVVVWEDDRDGNNYTQIRAAMFNKSAQRKTLDFTVNDDSNGNQRWPDIAMAPNGDFVVVWEDDSHGAQNIYQIYAKGYNADGTVKFPSKTVNSVSRGQQLRPVVGISGNGSFVIAWQDDNNNNGQFQILAARFNAEGIKQGNDFTVNSNATRQQRNPAIAMNNGGQFVVAWEDDSEGAVGTYQIYARGYTANGTAQFSDITVNSAAAGQQTSPSVAIAPDGRFLIAWQDDSKGAQNVYQIYARAFNSDGTNRIADFTVNSNSKGQQKRPDVGMDQHGNFVVVWEDDINGMVDPYLNYDGVEIVARNFTVSGASASSAAPIQ